MSRIDDMNEAIRTIRSFCQKYEWCSDCPMYENCKELPTYDWKEITEGDNDD